MIHLKQFVFNAFSVNTFLIYDDLKNCLLIDPACNSEEENQELDDYIQSNQLVLKAIANTHGHMDHLPGVRYFKEKYNIPFYLSEEDEFFIDSAVSHAAMFGFEMGQPPHPDKYLNDGEIFEFGEEKIELYRIPGHSPGSIVFHLPKHAILITGDGLFSGSIGRTDLPGGDYDQLIDGIKSRLLILDEKTIVYPGHGPSTTIGKEKKENPFLQ